MELVVKESRMMILMAVVASKCMITKNFAIVSDLDNRICFRLIPQYAVLVLSVLVNPLHKDSRLSSILAKQVEEGENIMLNELSDLTTYLDQGKSNQCKKVDIYK